VKFFYETNTDMQENFLTPDTQLARFERQAPYVFAYVHGRYWAENSGRYEGVGPGLKRQQQALPTLTSLKESADRIEASLTAATQAAPEVMMDALENEDETPEQAAQKVAGWHFYLKSNQSSRKSLFEKVSILYYVAMFLMLDQVPARTH